MILAEQAGERDINRGLQYAHIAHWRECPIRIILYPRFRRPHDKLLFLVFNGYKSALMPWIVLTFVAVVHINLLHTLTTLLGSLERGKQHASTFL